MKVVILTRHQASRQRALIIKALVELHHALQTLFVEREDVRVRVGCAESITCCLVRKLLHHAACLLEARFNRFISEARTESRRMLLALLSSLDDRVSR